ncbi:GspH/FimT family pseudopilin [Teredinibacter waterburyi]|uniref:GspH/FimT family pseudopilin n=1 Tax=Teredinibacter waterburyi TaxID=1500538 RepID=UPI001FEC5970|nr:GspH/FimT family pseudopilin [Teredinibacter waterburyi]
MAKTMGMRANKRCAGFSLLEILVVLVVIGVVMGGVSVSVNQGGPEKQMRSAVEKFANYADFASEMSVLNGRPFGLLLEPPSWSENPEDRGWRYKWQVMTEQGWIDYPELPAVELDREIKLFISIDDEDWDWQDAPEVNLPAIAFYPDGEATRFNIEFSLDDFDETSENVALDDWGRVVWVEKEEMLEEIKEELGDF